MKEEEKQEEERVENGAGRMIGMGEDLSGGESRGAERSRLSHTSPLAASASA